MALNRSRVGVKQTTYIGFDYACEIAGYINNAYLRRKSSSFDQNKLASILCVLAARKLEITNNSTFAVAVDNTIRSSGSGFVPIVNDLYSHLPQNGLAKAKGLNYEVKVSEQDMKEIVKYVRSGTFYNDLTELKTYLTSYSIGSVALALTSGTSISVYRIADKSKEDYLTLPLSLRSQKHYNIVSHLVISNLENGDDKAQAKASTFKNLVTGQTDKDGDYIITDDKIKDVQDIGLAVKNKTCTIDERVLDYSDYVFHTTKTLQSVDTFGEAACFIWPITIFTEDMISTNAFDVLVGTPFDLEFEDSFDEREFIQQSLHVISGHIFKDAFVKVSENKTPNVYAVDIKEERVDRSISVGTPKTISEPQHTEHQIQETSETTKGFGAASSVKPQFVSQKQPGLARKPFRQQSKRKVQANSIKQIDVGLVASIVATVLRQLEFS